MAAAASIDRRLIIDEGDYSSSGGPVEGMMTMMTMISVEAHVPAKAQCFDKDKCDFA